MSRGSRIVRVVAIAALVALVPLAASGSAPLLDTSAFPVASRGDSEGETGLGPAVPGPLQPGGDVSVPPGGSEPWPSVPGSPAPESAPPGSAPSTEGIPEPPFGPRPVCGTSLVVGASSPPSGAVRVPAGDNSKVDLSRSNTVYWFAPGTHTVSGRSFFAEAGTNSSYLGAPGAILDGRSRVPFAFVGGAARVRVQHLTIQNFGAEGGNKNVAAVNRDGGEGWTVRGNTIAQNAGAGVRAGSNSVTADNCLSDNGQLGLMSYDGDAGVFDISVTGNEIVGNNRDDWSRREPGCGCAAGAKFWNTENASVEGNYVHSNRATGLWADTNNRGFRFANNYISENDAFGIMYEISYNAQIVGNVLVQNGLVRGPTDPAFPTSAIYISESGSDPRVNTA